QFARHRPEDAGAAGLLLIVDDDGGIVVKADIAAVGTALLLVHPDDDGLDHVALLHGAAGVGGLDGGDDYIADSAGAAEGATEHTNAHDFLRAGIIGYLQTGLRLNHAAPSLLGLLDDLNQAPALFAAERTGFHHQNAVAHAALVVLVVRLELGGTVHNLAVQRMTHAGADGHNNGLVHLVADNHAGAGF